MSIRAPAASSSTPSWRCSSSASASVQSWIVALTILNLCLISAVMALGVNMQWGYAGLFNAGIMGFAALGGIGVVLTSMPPVKGALAAGGVNLGLAALFIILTLVAALFVRRARARLPARPRRPPRPCSSATS